MLRREFSGRVIGSGFAFQNFDEQESWRDRKVKASDIIFPNHKQDRPSEVTTYKIGENGELIKVN